MVMSGLKIRTEGNNSSVFGTVGMGFLSLDTLLYYSTPVFNDLFCEDRECRSMKKHCADAHMLELLRLLLRSAKHTHSLSAHSLCPLASATLTLKKGDEMHFGSCSRIAA